MSAIGTKRTKGRRPKPTPLSPWNRTHAKRIIGSEGTILHLYYTVLFAVVAACVFARVAEQVRDVLNHTTIDDAIRLSSEGETRLNGSRSSRVGTPLS
jgi:hypothetical protein